MSDKQRQMHLAVFVLGTGNHIAGWRYPGASQSFLSLPVIQKIAETAERGRFDMLFMGDSLHANIKGHPSFAARFEPITILSAIAATTKHIGLGATASTTYTEPYQVARAFASLDHISGGRAGWNVVTSGAADCGPNFGKTHPDHASRYEIAEEFVDVVTGLWDCWEDDAIVCDRETGVYVDPSKVRRLNHKGQFFSVQGPVNISRAPQGRPIIIQAGSSEPGQELAARSADVVFSVVESIDSAKMAYGNFKKRLPRYGRAAEDVAILPGFMPIVGRTDREARDKLDALQRLIGNSNSISVLSDRLGFDMSGYALDDLVPDLPTPDTSQGYARDMLARAYREKMTLRDLCNLVGAARGHYVLCGSPDTIADTLERWFVEAACDGFNILPPYFPDSFDEFVDLVVPRLQDRGIFRKEYSGPTLRDHLKLAKPGAVSRDTMSAMG